MSGAWRVVVSGVAGSGKSTVAAELARHYDARFLEGDDYHLPTSIKKMSAGEPLTDEDRWPWLAALRQQLREEQRVVLSCSALRRGYRDLLRGAGDVRFVQLVISEEEARRRLEARVGHFMGPGMVEGQFGTLEQPSPDEFDVAVVSDEDERAVVLEKVVAALDALPVRIVAPEWRHGGADAAISAEELATFVQDIAVEELRSRPLQRVLLVPPDLTRLASRAGEITGSLFELFSAAGAAVTVLPATGTHEVLDEEGAALLFQNKVPFAHVRANRWREDIQRIGEISAPEVRVVSDGRLELGIPVDVAGALLEDWDLVVSVGQVVPHEVTGMANFTKNLVIGLGGPDTINRSHFLGAVCQMEAIMGRERTPVRDVVDAAFDRFLDERHRVLFVLTVVAEAPEGVVLRGLFAGHGGSAGAGGGAYREAAGLSLECNVETVTEPFGRVACWLDPGEFRSTWLANKAIYRTRMAMADRGELIVLAPGVRCFGEDAMVDALIRRHGYRGTPATLAAVREDRELAANLSAAAHLIHGSSEGRFRIVYCTDPEAGGLTREEVEAVGYGWRHLGEELVRLDLHPPQASGPRLDAAARPYRFLANPALGLWVTAATRVDPSPGE